MKEYSDTSKMRNMPCSCIGLTDMLKCFNQTNMTLVEIGSFKGDSAQIFLDSGKVSKIYCVDPWKNYESDEHLEKWKNMESVENFFDNRFRDDERVVKIKGTIDDFILKEYSNIDFVYIDGCHSYTSCLNDIKKTINFIKPKIAICGHDYDILENDKHRIGVKIAVNETLNSPDIIFSDTSWMKIVDRSKIIKQYFKYDIRMKKYLQI